MGDFDFQGSLAKFDKHTVFNQIQAEDSVADEDRLVAHNRLPKAKPGTAGGKNLHYTENVLDGANGTVKLKTEIWKSEAGDSEDGERASLRGSGNGSGRLSRRQERAESKLSMNRRPVSRKGSNNIAIPPARTLSVGHLPRIRNYLLTNQEQVPNTSSKPSFYLVPSDRRCEPISALQMLNLENIADNELGLSEDMMTENAGRGIAEVALSALNAGGGGLTQGKSSTIPTVVVFAGNNKSGLRAVAAGRHIRNHGLNVAICVLGLERESELLVGLRRQLKVFRGFGGKVVTKVELLEYIKNLAVPIELIIDGLLGLTISFEELRTGDQATAYELIEWANRSKASVLAIDIPTGIEPTTGKVSIIDGRKLYIHAKYVVAMGAPKKGLLEAMALGEGIADEDGVTGMGREWQLFVADIGLGAAVWKKAGTRVRRGVEFEGSWVLGMRFQGGGD
jgi:enhancer of mRNA-decapping protein 3